MFRKLKNLLARWFGGGEPLELSYSKISAFRFCPWKYKLVYEDGLRTPPNPYTSLGSTVHKALEEYHKIPAGSLDDLMEIYNRVWINEGFQSPQQTMHFYDKGQKMLARYYESAKARKSEIVAVEKEFVFPVGQRNLRGVIDRIDRLPDGTCEVIDYKTHAEMWDSSRIDSDLQLTFYALGCRKALNMEPSALSYFFLAHDKVVTTVRTEAQTAEALALFEEVAKKIEARELSPNLSMCTRCDFKTSCAYSSVRAPAPAPAAAKAS